jgi:hypothetical protein
MPALQVRDFPADLYENLPEREKQEHRSISQQTIVAIREHLAQESSAWRQTGGQTTTESSYLGRREKFFENLDALPKLIVPEDFPTPEEIVREIRDSR